MTCVLKQETKHLSGFYYYYTLWAPLLIWNINSSLQPHAAMWPEHVLPARAHSETKISCLKGDGWINACMGEVVT